MCLAMLQDGKLQYLTFMRSKDPLACVLRAWAEYYYELYTVAKKQFPSTKNVKLW